MGGCVVGPISRLEEMSGLRTINPLRPAAPSQRVTWVRGRYSQPHPLSQLEGLGLSLQACPLPGPYI